jgi:putative ABC transport system substrate-binding protein
MACTSRIVPISRRQLLTITANSALLTCAASAQQPLPAVGFLHDVPRSSAEPELVAFWQGMNEAGFAEHRNVTCEYLWTDSSERELTGRVANLIKQGLTVVVAGGTANAMAAKRATKSIPVVFVVTSDPVKSRFVQRLAKPGGNMTGISLASPELLAARLSVFHELAPNLGAVVALLNPDAPNVEVQVQYLADESKRTGIHVSVLNATDESDFERALEAIAQMSEVGLVVANDGFLNSQRVRLVEFTKRYDIPAAFANREFVESGGLMSYGPSFIEAYRQAGGYIGRILTGATPADLAVENPTEIELTINSRTAKSFGFEIPSQLLGAGTTLVN